MFDIAPSELLLVAIVALIFIGPKDLPFALRTLGRWVGQARRMSNHFRTGVEAMIREAEMEEIEREWRERNARIMAEHPDGEAHEHGADVTAGGAQMEPIDRASDPDAAAAAAIARAKADVAQSFASRSERKAEEPEGEPQLPLSQPDKADR